MVVDISFPLDPCKSASTFRFNPRKMFDLTVAIFV